MSNFKEKAQVFIIGLSIGLLVAGGFFILKLDDYFKELALYKKVSQTFSSPPSIPVVSENTADDSKTEKKQKSSGVKSVNIADTIHNNDVGEGNVRSKDTVRTKTDSLVSIYTDDESIVVRKDELLSTKTLEVFNMSPTANKQTAKDSLMQRVSGIKDDKFAGKPMFNMELWSSPLNYKGYKMSKYKIVLYGITSFDGIKIYKLDDIIYMKNGSVVYRLDYASDFKQYEHITDDQIINKLK